MLASWSQCLLLGNSSVSSTAHASCITDFWDITTSWWPLEIIISWRLAGREPGPWYSGRVHLNWCRKAVSCWAEGLASFPVSLTERPSWERESRRHRDSSIINSCKHIKQEDDTWLVHGESLVILSSFTFCLDCMSVLSSCCALALPGWARLPWMILALPHPPPVLLLSPSLAPLSLLLSAVMGPMSTHTSLLSEGQWGRRERIRSARESVGWREGPVRSRLQSTSTKEHLFAAAC